MVDFLMIEVDFLRGRPKTAQALARKRVEMEFSKEEFVKRFGLGISQDELMKVLIGLQNRIEALEAEKSKTDLAILELRKQIDGMTRTKFARQNVMKRSTIKNHVPSPVEKGGQITYDTTPCDIEVDRSDG